MLYTALEDAYLELFLYAINSEDTEGKAYSDLVQGATLYSSLKVDLLTIAIGPEHHDIVLVDPKKSTMQIGRISYCVSCSHIENISLRIQSVDIQINSLLKNELALKLKFKDAKNQLDTLYTGSIDSKPHAKEEITSYEYHPMTPGENVLKIDNVMSMQELRAADASVNIYSTRLIEYNRINSLNLIPKRIGTNTRQSSTTLGKVANNTNKEQPTLNLVPYYTLLGFTTLNFYKILYENDSNILKQTSKFFQSMSNKNQWNQLNNKNGDNDKERYQFQVFQTLNEKFVDEIFYKGTSIGKIIMKIEIKNIPLIRQIMCGVMTETGFEINSIFLYDNNPLLLNNKENMNSLPYELQTLIKEKNQLELEIANKTQLRTVSGTEKDFNISILKHLNDIRVTLEKSIEEGCLYYGYSNTQDLYQGQAVMLELGLNCLEIIDKLNMDQRAICFDILRLLHERSEFDLGTLSLRWFNVKVNNNRKCSTNTNNTNSNSNNEKDFRNSNVVFKDNKLIEMKIVENFIQFNNESLRFALECIARGKNIDNESKQFSLFFLSSAYFRIPIYRDCFIQSILKGIDQGVYKNQKQIALNASIDELIDLDPINSLILWDKLFYKKLISSLSLTLIENEIQDRLNEMNDIISLSTHHRRNDWKDRLSKRDFVFFDLINTLDSFLQNKIMTSTNNIDINWLNIPGFDSIILAINHELQDRDVKNYPRLLLDIIPMFSNNISIINSFTSLIFNKTNVYDVIAVFNAINFLDLLFNQCNSRPNPEQFRSRFAYNTLLASLNIIIASEHSLSLSKTLWFYYKNAHLLSIEHISEVINSSLFNHFYTLFFHWSWQVRNIFYYLILYIIGHRLQGKLPVVLPDITTTDKHGVSLCRISSQRFSAGNEMTFTEYFESKMVPIQEIQNIIYTEELDPSYSTVGDLEKFQNVLVVIPEKLHSNILVSMHHYDMIEVEYERWKMANDVNIQNNNPIDYPIVNIVPPKDDIVDYTDD